MTITKTTYKIMLWIFTLLNLQLSMGQKNSENALIDWFDQKNGKENLDLNNGILFYDAYPIINNATRYIKNEEFLKGKIIYNNQTFNNVYMNYDLYTDDLLIKPNGEFDRIPIITIKDKIESFSFEGRNFVNLNYNKKIKEEFINGYYEELITVEKLNFFEKHLKTKRQVFYNDKVYYEFEVAQEYILLYKNKYYKIDSKKTIQTIFPELKSKISKFYSDNSRLAEENKTLFFKTLLIDYIIPSLQ